MKSPDGAPCFPSSLVAGAQARTLATLTLPGAALCSAGHSARAHYGALGDPGEVRHETGGLCLGCSGPPLLAGVPRPSGIVAAAASVNECTFVTELFSIFDPQAIPAILGSHGSAPSESCPSSASVVAETQLPGRV